MADYLDDRLDTKKKAGIDAHLSECPRCLDDFLIANSIPNFREGLEADSVPQRVTEAAVALVTKLVSQQQDLGERGRDSFFARLYSRISEHLKLIQYNKNRFAHVRGSGKPENGDFYRIRRMFNDMVTEIEVEKAGDQIAVIRVTLIKGFVNGNDIRVTLRNRDREIASHRVSGRFLFFESVPFGYYSLVFMQRGKKIGTYSFEVKESS